MRRRPRHAQRSRSLTTTSRQSAPTCNPAAADPRRGQTPVNGAHVQQWSLRRRSASAHDHGSPPRTLRADSDSSTRRKSYAWNRSSPIVRTRGIPAHARSVDSRTSDALGGPVARILLANLHDRAIKHSTTRGSLGNARRADIASSMSPLAAASAEPRLALADSVRTVDGITAKMQERTATEKIRSCA